MLPIVSIVLTSYNHEKFLAQSIDSILSQSFKDFELYIIDDASSDNSWNIIKSYSDPRIIAKRREANVYLEPDENHPLEGKYLAIAHSDDFWLPDKLEKQVAYMEENLSCAACFTRVTLVTENGDVLQDTSHPYYGIFADENQTRHEWLNRFIFQGNCLCHPSVMIRNDIFAESNANLYSYSVPLFSIPDFYRWFAICLRHDIYIYPERLTCFRVHLRHENQSADTIKNRIRYQIESWHLLQLCREISDIEEIVKIFPSVKQYMINDKSVPKYLMAKALLDSAYRKPQIYLLGLTLLFELLNDSEQRAKVREFHNYTFLDYRSDTAKFDVFHCLSPDRFQLSSLYFDYGEGYSERDAIKKEVYIQSRRNFFVSFELENAQKARRIHRLRFDPVEGKVRKYKIKGCFIDNQPVEIKRGNGYGKDEWDVFLTTDPKYEISVPDIPFNKVDILGSYESVRLRDFIELVTKKLKFW